MKHFHVWLPHLMLIFILLLTACQPVLLEPEKAVDEPQLISTTLMHEFPFQETNNVVGTLSTLVRTAEGAHVLLETTGLTPGDAYTLWWVVFNYPDDCTKQGCLPQNLMEAKMAAMVKYGVGAIANEDGTATFEAFLAVGDVTGALDNSSGFDFELFEPAPGLIEPLSAEFHVVLRSHGAALDDPTEQLTTFNGGCNPECFNVQMAMHIPDRS